MGEDSQKHIENGYEALCSGNGILYSISDERSHSLEEGDHVTIHYDSTSSALTYAIVMDAEYAE